MVENKQDNILNDNELLNSIQSIYIHINKRGHFNGNEETSSKNLMIIRSKRMPNQLKQANMKAVLYFNNIIWKWKSIVLMDVYVFVNYNIRFTIILNFIQYESVNLRILYKQHNGFCALEKPTLVSVCKYNFPKQTLLMIANNSQCMHSFIKCIHILWLYNCNWSSENIHFHEIPFVWNSKINARKLRTCEI